MMGGTKQVGLSYYSEEPDPPALEPMVALISGIVRGLLRVLPVSLPYNHKFWVETISELYYQMTVGVHMPYE